MKRSRDGRNSFRAELRRADVSILAPARTFQVFLEESEQELFLIGLTAQLWKVPLRNKFPFVYVQTTLSTWFSTPCRGTVHFVDGPKTISPGVEVVSVEYLCPTFTFGHSSKCPLLHLFSEGSKNNIYNGEPRRNFFCIISKH